MDKIIDKKGNLSFLVSHLEKVFSRTLIKIAFFVVTFLEITSGILCLLGTFQLLFFEQKQLGLIGIFVGSVALLVLLFGQRVSRNYDGAQTIAVYFILSIIGVLLS
ncbi:MAG: DoxX family protein [Flavobacteriaceae bacterium]|nr:DoxX family protein [Flavobacteriaceae bacterium]